MRFFESCRKLVFANNFHEDFVLFKIFIPENPQPSAMKILWASKSWLWLQNFTLKVSFGFAKSKIWNLSIILLMPRPCRWLCISQSEMLRPCIIRLRLAKCASQVSFKGLSEKTSRPLTKCDWLKPTARTSPCRSATVAAMPQSLALNNRILGQSPKI